MFFIEVLQEMPGLRLHPDNVHQAFEFFVRCHLRHENPFLVERMVAEQLRPARFAIETCGIGRLIIQECAQFVFARHDPKVVRQPAAVRTEIAGIFWAAALSRIPEGRDAIVATTFVSEKVFETRNCTYVLCKIVGGWRISPAHVMSRLVPFGIIQGSRFLP